MFREELILAHLPQLRLIARRVHLRIGCRVSLDDLCSAGTIGLIRAVDDFQGHRGVKLKSYAEWRIRGAILDSLRVMDPVSRRIRRREKEREIAIHKLSQALQRFPTADEIAGETNLPLESQFVPEIVSETDLAAEWNTPNPFERLSQRVAPSPENCALVGEIRSAICELPPRQAAVISLVAEGWTLQEIAVKLAITVPAVSRLKRLWLGNLRASLAA